MSQGNPDAVATLRMILAMSGDVARLPTNEFYDLCTLRPSQLQDVFPGITLDESQKISSDLRERDAASLSEHCGKKIVHDPSVTTWELNS